MAGYLYILQTKGNHYYIGSTCDLERRMAEHSCGKTKSLKNLLPVQLVFSEKFEDIKLARQLESKLKKSKSRKIREQIIKDGVIKMGL